MTMADSRNDGKGTPLHAARGTWESVRAHAENKEAMSALRIGVLKASANVRALWARVRFKLLF